MNIILEELKNYFQETPHEKILSDWKELEKYSQVGPTIQEFKQLTKFYFQYEDKITPENSINCNILANPKFNFGFLF